MLSVATMACLLCMLYVGYLFTTYFGSNGTTSGNIYIKTTKKSCWIMCGLCIIEKTIFTRMAFVSFSLSQDTRVCECNSGQCIALYT
jgi:hypothetical protein